jgi:hypothetical protein
MAYKTYHGYFKPKHPEKYKGDPNNIIYRSRWESLVMSKLDEHPDVIWWQSEETVIPYRSPVDGRVHRYFPDFLVRMKDANGKFKTILIEVKPYAQTQPPVIKEGASKRTKKYITEVCTYGINSAKWNAAREYCKDRQYEFMIMTERELGIKF